MFSAITDSFNTSNVSNVASLPKFPSEEPSKKDLDDWLDVAGAVLTRAGYGSAMRDETPPHLIHLSHSKDMAPIFLLRLLRRLLPEPSSPPSTSNYALNKTATSRLLSWRTLPGSGSTSTSSLLYLMRLYGQTRVYDCDTC